MRNNDKKEDHNTDVSNGVEKFLMENLIKNFKNGALSKNLIQSIKSTLSKTLSRNLKTVLYQGK